MLAVWQARQMHKQESDSVVGECYEWQSQSASESQFRFHFESSTQPTRAWVTWPHRHPPALLNAPVSLAITACQPSGLLCYSVTPTSFQAWDQVLPPILPLLLSGLLNCPFCREFTLDPHTSGLPVTFTVVPLAPTVYLAYVVPVPRFFFLAEYWITHHRFPPLSYPTYPGDKRAHISAITKDTFLLAPRCQLSTAKTLADALKLLIFS